jgi:hypothetical protein
MAQAPVFVDERVAAGETAGKFRNITNTQQCSHRQLLQQSYHMLNRVQAESISGNRKMGMITMQAPVGQFKPDSAVSAGRRTREFGVDMVEGRNRFEWDSAIFWLIGCFWLDRPPPTCSNTADDQYADESHNAAKA